MSARDDRRPVPWKQLFQNLFASPNEQQTVQIISAGLVAILNNVKRLVDDVTLLGQAERYSTAIFLLTTADEEMAKSYILMDMCRLDFLTHQSVYDAFVKPFTTI